MRIDIKNIMIHKKSGMEMIMTITIMMVDNEVETMKIDLRGTWNDTEAVVQYTEYGIVMYNRKVRNQTEKGLRIMIMKITITNRDGICPIMNTTRIINTIKGVPH